MNGLRVLSFESRRSAELAELIRRHGGEPIAAPALRELPRTDNQQVFEYLDGLARREFDLVILMTGVGLRTLVEIAAARYPAAEVAARLRAAKLVARGPKPVAALRELKLAADITIPEPNTWREIVTTLERDLRLAGLRIAVQEYGVSNLELLAALRERGALVTPVAIYRWALPLDLEPLKRAVDQLAQASVDVAVFTSATQVHHLFLVAGEHADAVRRGCRRVLIASIGPICSEALVAHGLAVDLEPEHAKLGQLVRALAQEASERLQRKRAQQP